jgi:hypothetical protein
MPAQCEAAHIVSGKREQFFEDWKMATYYEIAEDFIAEQR